MNQNSLSQTLPKDLISGLVVFLVALPLCLGVALASNAPLFSGILAGIVGGILVGVISGSQTSVSGPAAGLTAVVASQIENLGTFDAFLVAVIIGGLIQIGMSIFRLGFISAFFPSSVVKGLLAAIGVILILKQIPHVMGNDADPIGNKSFFQSDNRNTFTEIIDAVFLIQPGAALVGFFSLALLFLWDRIKFLKNSLIPGPLVVILISVWISSLLYLLGDQWVIGKEHLVQVPVAKSTNDFFGFFMFPDLSILKETKVYFAGITIAIIASLETLLNLEAIEKIDPLQRSNPANRELLAQGVGNVVSGLIGGLPMTSVIVRSSVNINSGGQTKLSTIWHGLLLLLSVMFFPEVLNKIPLSALAAILLVTGLKLASPQLLSQMWKEGKYQFLPFIITVIAIVLTDILIGVIIGLIVAIGFILHSNFSRPLKKVMEKHSTGENVLHVELPNQVSFLNKPTLENTLKSIPEGGHVLIDASNTDYIDPDILDLISDFQNQKAKIQNVTLSLVGFKDRYPKLEDRIQFIDFSNRESQDQLTPEHVLEILQEGNNRFRAGNTIKRDVSRQISATSRGQYPMAVVLSCIDSRTPAEIIFDLGLGDIFSVRIAGNVLDEKILASMEFGCAVAGAKLLLVMGHTSCGAVNAAVSLKSENKKASVATGCANIDSLVEEIQESIKIKEGFDFKKWDEAQKKTFCDEVSYRNILRTMQLIYEKSSTLDKLLKEGKIALVGAMYDIATAKVSFFQPTGDYFFETNTQDKGTHQ